MKHLSENEKVLALSLVVGLCAGIAAVALKMAIALLSGGLGAVFASGTPASRIFLSVCPVVGLLLSLLLVKYLVRDDISHGVTKVLVAVSKRESRIKPHNMWSSMLTSAVTIGFGGSVGAEAPIVYTGAAIGSNLARAAGLSYRSMTLLLGCGAAAAVAGIFNAPLAGVLFTLEILLFNLSMSSILPLLLASVSATVVSYLLMGQEPMFSVTLTRFSLGMLPLAGLLGLVCGLGSIYFIRMTLSLEDWIGKVKGDFARWAICSLPLAALVFFLPELRGEGYGVVGNLLSGGVELSSVKLYLYFLAILVFKVFSMSFTNAGGGVGGTFGPTLFVGAVLGFISASLFSLIFPGTVTVPHYVLLGMAGLMAGVMKAPLTAIFLLAEASGGYQLFIPLIVTVTVSYGISRLDDRHSIYARRIARSGELLTHDSDQAVLTLLNVSQVVETDFSPVAIDDTLGTLVETVSGSRRNIFPVVDSHGRFQGYVPLEAVRQDMFRPELYADRHVFNYMRTAPDYVYSDDSMETVMRKFEATSAWNLPVVEHEGRKYLGFVSKSKIFNAYRDELKVFSQD